MAGRAVEIPPGYGPPVVMAGVGGSGTRVAAALLAELGFYLGEDLNKALDNLFYTFLLKRPRWYEREAPRQRRLNAGARPFVRSMTTAGTPPPRELLTLAGAMAGTIPRGHDRLGRRRGLRWAPKITRRIIAAHGHDPARHPGWGWKEPNAIMLLPELAAAFPQMRFIHVHRDPQLVARRKDQTMAMVCNWSRHIGLRPPRPGDDLYALTLDFCTAVTERTEQFARANLGGRYFKLDIDVLCADTDVQLDALLAFLGIGVDDAARERLRAIPDPGRLAAGPPATS